MTEIRMQEIECRLGPVTAVDGISVDFPDGSFTALLGPSGSGKSTLLRLIAGFESPDAGSIHFDDRLMSDPVRQVPPERRGVGIVFQSHALWPHMDVAGNVSYALKPRGDDRRTMEAKVEDALAVVELEGFGLRRVDELSSGQRQRVALARCLVADPGIILFDEPLANLDMHLRASTLKTFRDIQIRTGTTVIYVTHDQAEALALADRVAVLDRGRLLQVAAPREIYDSPANGKVARFIGRGSIVAGRAELSGDGITVRIAGHGIAARCARLQPGPVRVLLRPEALRLCKTGLPATVTATAYHGSAHEVRLKLRNGEEILLDEAKAPAVGEDVHVAVSDAWIIPEE